jgi:hypothetical protein
MNWKQVEREMRGEPQTYRVTKAYVSPYPDSIIFRMGETVEVGNEFTGDPDWKSWVWCEGVGDAKAWVPRQYLDVRGNRGTVTRDYDARELSVSVGEELFVYEIVNGFGMAEKSDGTRGWVPMKNLELVGA